MERRTGIVGIFLEDKAAAARVNTVLSQHADIILARMGLPIKDHDLHVISLIVHGTTDELGSLTGKLGRLSGVSVKSLLAKPGGAHERPDPLHPS